MVFHESKTEPKDKVRAKTRNPLPMRTFYTVNALHLKKIRVMHYLTGGRVPAGRTSFEEHC